MYRVRTDGASSWTPATPLAYGYANVVSIWNGEAARAVEVRKIVLRSDNVVFGSVAAGAQSDTQLSPMGKHQVARITVEPTDGVVLAAAVLDSAQATLPSQVVCRQYPFIGATPTLEVLRNQLEAADCIGIGQAGIGTAMTQLRGAEQFRTTAVASGQHLTLTEGTGVVIMQTYRTTPHFAWMALNVRDETNSRAYRFHAVDSRVLSPGHHALLSLWNGTGSGVTLSIPLAEFKMSSDGGQYINGGITGALGLRVTRLSTEPEFGVALTPTKVDSASPAVPANISIIAAGHAAGNLGDARQLTEIYMALHGVAMQGLIRQVQTVHANPVLRNTMFHGNCFEHVLWAAKPNDEGLRIEPREGLGVLYGFREPGDGTAPAIGMYTPYGWHCCDIEMDFRVVVVPGTARTRYQLGVA